MKTDIDKRAETQWEKSCRSYENYQDYLNIKEQAGKRFRLTFIDLLYISNFKGGNATINEREQSINNKLISYSEKFKELDDEFQNMQLSDLNDYQKRLLIDKVLDICNLITKGSDNKIDGFGVSYLSALLHAYFPTLIPILDRRVLINMELVTEKDKDSQKQIKQIIRFYKPLIEKTAQISKEKKLTLRDIDKMYFIREIGD